MHKVYAIYGNDKVAVYTAPYLECVEYCEGHNWHWIDPKWKLEITKVNEFFRNYVQADMDACVLDTYEYKNQYDDFVCFTGALPFLPTIEGSRTKDVLFMTEEQYKVYLAMEDEDFILSVSYEEYEKNPSDYHYHVSWYDQEGVYGFKKRNVDAIRVFKKRKSGNGKFIKELGYFDGIICRCNSGMNAYEYEDRIMYICPECGGIDEWRKPEGGKNYEDENF